MISKDEVSVLQESSRNARVALETIDAVLNKVYDDELSYELNCQANRFRELERKVRRAMRREGVEPKEQSRLKSAMRWGSIQANTLLNTSTSHVADMMIQGNARGVTDLQKVTYNNKAKGSYANELARELMDFEESNIQKLKSYL